MRKPHRKKIKLTLISTTIKPELARRFFHSPEYDLHENISATLRAILDKVLPECPESQGKNEKNNPRALAG